MREFRESRCLRQQLEAGFGLAAMLMGMAGCTYLGQAPAGPRLAWRVVQNNRASATQAVEGSVLVLDYDLAAPLGWSHLRANLTARSVVEQPVRFWVKAEGDDTLEIKFTDADGTIHCSAIALDSRFNDWRPVVAARSEAERTWQLPADQRPGCATLEIGVVGVGRGRLFLREIELCSVGTPTNVAAYIRWLAPTPERPGIGFDQRMAGSLTPADPGVLAWLEQIQDTASPEQALLSSMENNEGQTFNNALAAMAFVLCDRRERAERILDFFQAATVENNTDPDLQSFFLNGEPRGFFQAVDLADYHQHDARDRWMGDNAWLAIACIYYRRTYASERYTHLESLLVKLLKSWYREVPGHGGYVQHGWREGDKRLHEDHGHHEGNIDAYALFRLIGEEALADQIRLWLDDELEGRVSLPLDLYSWRVLAFGEESRPLLDLPDHDLRYRQTMLHHGQAVTGFFAIPLTEEPANIWIDGTAHMATAYFSAGDLLRGNFYANQLDTFLIDPEIGGRQTRALPFTANREHGYDWVQLDRGFASVAAWYLFAKHRFNPLSLETTR